MKIYLSVLFLPQALEYLLWASMCMEFSVPLLSVRYLTWRATLYTAVCQCYYDCQAGVHAEVGHLSFSASQYWKLQVISIFFFRCPATQTQTDKTWRIAVEQGRKSQGVPAEVCLASPFYWSLALHSALSFALCSLPPPWTLFWIRFLISFLPRWILSYKSLFFPI